MCFVPLSDSAFTCVLACCLASGHLSAQSSNKISFFLVSKGKSFRVQCFSVQFQTLPSNLVL